MKRLLSIFRREPAPLRCTPDNLHAAGLRSHAIDWSHCNWPVCGCPRGTVSPDCPAIVEQADRFRQAEGMNT